MAGQLAGVVAVVTGASRGMGRGIAVALGDAGATVYVTGRSGALGATTERLAGTFQGTAEEVTARGGRGIGVRCDHTSDADVEALFRRVGDEQGRLDLLVNNVWGGYEHHDEAFVAPFWEQPLAQRWQGMFQAGVRAHLIASGAAVPFMLPRRRGLIVNISAGDRGKYLGSVPYDTAKAAVDRMAFGMARELAVHGITALAVHPGFTRTERVLSATDDLVGTESPEYTGRAVAALAADPDVHRWAGQAVRTGELAREYGVRDIDGTQPPPFNLPDNLPDSQPVG